MLLRASLLLVVLASPGLVGADTHFTIEVEREVRAAGESRTLERHPEAWAGSAGARLDSGDLSWIFQAEPPRLFLIDPAAKTYQVFPIPFSAADYVPETYRGEFLKSVRSFSPETRLEGPGAAETIEGYASRRYLATVTLAGLGSVEIEAWLSLDLGERCALIERLLSAQTWLNLLYGDAERQILDLPGCTVRQIVRIKKPDVQIITELRLIAIRDAPAEAGRYAPPAGYREVPVDSKVVGGFLPAQPLPSI